ncbi:MAG TPA: methyltransferase domain-containing protein [Nitrospiraceae bacterium]|jgi:SAM-dependent methyltransferase|nr:methyltransferase domain-containing protein [Nitrospiraceae bacterium]
MDKREIYTPGYSEAAVRYMQRRHAARDAAFFLPYLKPGMQLLDCGCGPGTITIGLAEAVSPGQVVGVDLEPGQIAIAEQIAGDRGLKNLRFEAASVYRLPFPDHSFDAVYSHALFEHLGDPLTAAREIRRVLKPGGIAGISSPDWSGNLMAPSDPAMGKAIEAYWQLQRLNGGNPFVGRGLGRLLQEAGFSRISLTAMYDCYEEIELFIELLAQRFEAERGKLADVDRHCRAMREWVKQPVAMFAQSYVEAVGYAAP